MFWYSKWLRDGCRCAVLSRRGAVSACSPSSRRLPRLPQISGLCCTSTLIGCRVSGCRPGKQLFFIPRRRRSGALERNASRPDRDLGPGPVRRQHAQLRKSLRGLRREGFRRISVLSAPEEIAGATIVRDQLLNDYRHMGGPFDIIGDVHGCLDELVALLEKLGYRITQRRRRAPDRCRTSAGAHRHFLSGTWWAADPPVSGWCGWRWE